MTNKIFSVFIAAISLISSVPAVAGGVGAGGGGDRPTRFDVASIQGDFNCPKGPYIYLKEDVTPHLRPTYKDVLYVCIDGVYRREGRVPRYNTCQHGEDRYVKERQNRGNHEVDVNVRYTCVRGRLVRNP